jgi:exonuclease III
MKIISWNCRSGFNLNKAKYIEKYSADLYVIQECTSDDVEKLQSYKKYSKWYGDNIDSKYGVAIFSDTYNIDYYPEINPDFRFLIPFKVSDNNDSYIVFVVWTKDKDKNNKKIKYTEPTWNAINYNGYKDILSGSVILIGDFNSNNHWHDEYGKAKVPSHCDIDKKLKEFNIESAYHKFNKCNNGNENDPTLIWQDKYFHIDYCYISNDFEIKDIKIETIEEWEKTKYSDHCPLIVELEKICFIKKYFEEEFSKWDIKLPNEVIEKMESGYIQKAGWLIQYCFGKENGILYMDTYEYHRMTDGIHRRVYNNGEIKDLANFKIGYKIDKDPQETEKNKIEFENHNKMVAKELIEKGFDKFTMNMALLAGFDK